MDRENKIALGIAGGAFVLGNLLPQVMPWASAAETPQRIASTTAPVHVGAYTLVTDTPLHPDEDEIGWNCYADGNRDCGPAVVPARGFSRPSWGAKCVYYPGDRVGHGFYVMCSDGSVYVKP